MLTLLQKFLLHNDPIHAGFTAMGIAAAAPLSDGFGWRGPGRMMLFRGDSRDAIDKTRPVGVAASSAHTIDVRDGVELADGTHFFQAIPYGPFGVAGVPSIETPQIVSVVIASGSPEDLRPAAPRGLKATVKSGGAIMLSWQFVAAISRPDIASFEVFSDNATGTVDYGTPIATINAKLGRHGEGLYCWEGVFSDGVTYKFGVRSGTSGDVDDGNVATVTATADASEPHAGVIDTLTLGDDE
jgi:hypothetical protein